MYDRTEGRPVRFRFDERHATAGWAAKMFIVSSTESARRSTAVVLGGGGATGVAWLAGVVHGLFDEGVDLRSADLVVGTSAGSVVGSWLATGIPFEDLEARVLNDTGVLAAEAMSAIDLMALMKVFTVWDKLPDATPASLALVGDEAKLARTIGLARFRELIDPELPEAWPAAAFLATAVDADTGEFVVLSAASGVPLADAVAASICVPGIFPPVPVGGRLLVDGGLRSGTSADLAAGYNTVVVLAPIGSRTDGMDPEAGRLAAAEVRALEAAGTTCTLLFPDDNANDMIGINRMDATISGGILAHGRRQGRALASSITWP